MVLQLITGIFLGIVVIIGFLLSGMAFEDESDRISAIMFIVGFIALILYGFTTPALLFN